MLTKTDERMNNHHLQEILLLLLGSNQYSRPVGEHQYIMRASVKTICRPHILVVTQRVAFMWEDRNTGPHTHTPTNTHTHTHTPNRVESAGGLTGQGRRPLFVWATAERWEVRVHVNTPWWGDGDVWPWTPRRSAGKHERNAATGLVNK